MKPTNPDDDSMLHAYVDNELDTDAKRRLLLRLDQDSAARDRVCELRNTKEWVKFSFEGMSAPTRDLPENPGWLGKTTLLRVAASILVMLCTFAAGWFGGSAQNSDAARVLVENTRVDPRHIVLHIGASDNRRFGELLSRAERILEEYRGTDVKLEVVTNAGGLDLVRRSSSSYADRIEAMIGKYENVRFIACSRGLERLRREGRETALIPGVQSDGAAADHLILRLQEGWTYIGI